MRERVMRKISRCTFCNGLDIHVHPSDDHGIFLCLCKTCGNKWGQ